MSRLSRGVLTIQKVYRYEKTGDVDKKALQSVMIAFAVVLFLIDIENYHLGKFGIGMVTFAVGIVSVLAAVAVNYLKNIRLVCRVVVFLFLLFSVPISVLGANEGFSLLWYLLLPVIHTCSSWDAVWCSNLYRIWILYDGAFLDAVKKSSVVCVSEGLSVLLSDFLLGILSDRRYDGYFLQELSDAAD